MPLEESKAPSGVRLKFHPDGRTKRFEGNTFICPLPEKGNERAAELFAGFCRDLLAAPFASKLSMLPKDSYHMTVFDGLNDATEALPNWITHGTPIADTHALVAQRAAGIQQECALPLRMQVNDEDPILKGWDLNWAPVILSLQSASTEQETALRHLRDRLSACLGIRSPNHDIYGFHMTFAYVCQRLTDEERTLYQAMRQRVQTRMKEEKIALNLSDIQFCAFRDMRRFEPIMSLQP